MDLDNLDTKIYRTSLAFFNYIDPTMKDAFINLILDVKTHDINIFTKILGNLASSFFLQFLRSNFSVWKLMDVNLLARAIIHDSEA